MQRTPPDAGSLSEPDPARKVQDGEQAGVRGQIKPFPKLRDGKTETKTKRDGSEPEQADRAGTLPVMPQQRPEIRCKQRQHPPVEEGAFLTGRLGTAQSRHPDQVEGRGRTGPHEIDDGNGQQHPGQEKPADVAREMIGLRDQGHSRPDGQKQQASRPFAPGSGRNGSQQHPAGRCLGAQQDREGDSSAERPRKFLPIVCQDQNDPETDQGGAENRSDDQTKLASCVSTANSVVGT